MPEKRVKVQMPGAGSVEGVEVPVRESTERWSDITLEDGTVLRVKPIIMGAVRIDGQWDPEGNPVYALKANQVTVVAASDPIHRRPPAGTPIA